MNIIGCPIVYIVFTYSQNIFSFFHNSLTLPPFYVWAEKRIKQQDFQTTWTKACLVQSLGHGIKNSKAKTRCVHDVNAKVFYYKNMTKIKQDHDKDMYPKLVLNKLKVIWDSTFFYTHWAPSSRGFSRNF